MKLSRDYQMINQTKKNEIVIVGLGRKGDITAWVLTKEKPVVHASTLQKFNDIQNLLDSFDFCGDWLKSDDYVGKYEFYKKILGGK
jgi:hypothetical protein